jgi:1-aminocyclopropane-1-carboxylate deaminase
MKIESHEIFNDLFKKYNVKVFIKRLDKIPNSVTGNKYYKLKYNILQAKKNSSKQIITFGGAFSNHVLATSIISKENNLKSIAFIRGEETLPLNSTLKIAASNGMKIFYLSRTEYRNKHNPEFQKKLKLKYGDCYIIEEGGTNFLAVKGTQEIISDKDIQDYICCPVGTGGTISGIINKSKTDQKVIGFMSLKNKIDVQKDISLFTNKKNWILNHEFTFGGYAKYNKELVSFISNFYKKYNIPLDLVYNAKMFYGIYNLIKKRKIMNCSILLIHTGGLQGNLGMNHRFNLNLPTF